MLKQEWEKDTGLLAGLCLSACVPDDEAGLGATHLDKPVTVGTVVDDGQGLLESGSPDPNNICDQLADGNNDLRDTQIRENHFTFK